MMENFLVKRNWNEISSNEKSLWRNFISYLTILLVDFGEIKNSWFINVKRIWLLISHPEHLADVNHVCSHWYVYVFDELAQTPKCGTRFNQDFFGFSSLFFLLIHRYNDKKSKCVHIKLTSNIYPKRQIRAFQPNCANIYDGSPFNDEERKEKFLMLITCDELMLPHFQK